jgi:hypothetical protein
MLRYCCFKIPSNTVRSSYRIGKRFYSTEKEPILTELVYGRKRIYTSLQTISKTKSATASKGRIAAPLTISPMSWEWVQPQEQGQTKKKEWYELRSSRKGSSVINSIKQNMREMFLPVGYPDSVHDCYKKFHAWLFVETYVGSTVRSGKKH